MDVKNLKFHIESDDYFGTLATLLTWMAEDLENNRNTQMNIEHLKDKITELMYLQRNYKIAKK